MSDFQRTVKVHGLYKDMFDGTLETEAASISQAYEQIQYFSQPLRFCVLQDVARLSHLASVSRGWWNNLDTLEDIPRNIGELYALFFTELGEAFEGYRTNAKSTKIPDFTNEEEELADLLIRLFDYTTPRGIRIWEAYFAKMEYNLKRPDHSLTARREKNGKKL